ncbi:MAG TPA: hypothetical protein VN132_00445 [Bdellovibrio sp.]|nr:hypothetical protein [Bdellovibrio sp.]
MKKFVLITTLLALAACSYSDNHAGSSKQTKVQAENNQQARNSFELFVGSYSGVLKTSSGDEKIQINLNLLAIANGAKNPDGSAQIQVVPAAAYIKIDPAGQPLTNFSISYVPETGEITLVNEDQKSAIDEVNTIFGKVIHGRFTGEVKSAAGSLGTLNLQLSTNQTSKPVDNAQEEYNNRLRAQYNSIAGHYVGSVTPVSGGYAKNTYTVQMNLSVFEVADSAGGTSPALTGMFHRDYDPTGMLDVSLLGVYRPDLTPATLTITGKSALASNGYVSTFYGVYKNGVFDGTFSSTAKGLEGHLHLEKQQ